MKYIKTLTGIIIIVLLNIVSCSTPKNREQLSEPVNNEIDSGAIIVKYQNTVFSIPSPQQVNSFIRKTSKMANRSLANQPTNVQRYTTSVKQALNLGVYGADYGYVNLFLTSDNNQAYSKTIKLLVSDLGLNSVITSDVINDVQKYNSNPDSLLKKISEVYALADQYLIENQKQQTSTLIISGGWIESIYLLAQIYKIDKQKEFYKMLAQQKFPLENIIKLLSVYYKNSNEIAQLTDDLVDLAYDFEIVDFKNTGQNPTIVKDSDVFVINNESEIIDDSTRIFNIIEKISDIRKNITE